MPTFQHLFGPVASRRFGRSLGIDLLPPKTCTTDCGFCEVGATTCLTLERREYVPVAKILVELEAWCALGIPTDFITVAGSGEPTLHARFGEVLAAIRSAGRARSALLTNSTLLHLPEVRHDAARADVVKVTFSAWDQDSFRAVCRPHPDLRFADLVDGLRLFRAEYPGAIWMEVFVVPGVNAEPDQMIRIADLARSIAPDRVQLNTAVRPGADVAVRPVDAERLRALAAAFGPEAEVIARCASGRAQPYQAGADTFLAMIRRRPCTADDMAHVFSMPPVETEILLSALVSTGRARMEERGGARFFLA